ncbi:HTH-type transcriptional regulator YofA [mine drainage metagenome]|uniref:HTH-type transcriptional regulator YofA n=1 Tax=mine drainage metagenome TaxID=410659 RepID=A0A1J5Q7W2_9ZZZZ
MMKHLEVRLGVRLFERMHGRLVATPDAQRLFTEIERVYSGVERVREVALGLHKGQGVRLSVVCSPSIGISIAPSALAAFAARFPSIDIDFSVQPVAPLLDDIAVNRCDLGISIVPVNHPGIQQRYLADVPVVIALPDSAARVKGKSLRWKDLNGQPYIGFAKDSVQGAQVNKLLEDAGVSPEVRLTTRVAIDALRLVQRGMGFAIVDALSAHAFEGQGVTIKKLPQTFAYAVTAHWSMTVPLSHHQLLFIEALQTELEKYRSMGVRIARG